jgi:HD-like signal output (HDOD) protein
MEREAFGYDHSQVGAMLAETWNLPEPLIASIADHHLVGERAPVAVEAVSHVRHCKPPDELHAFRSHCHTRLRLSQPDLDAMIEAAGLETATLADSLRPATATPH